MAPRLLGVAAGATAVAVAIVAGRMLFLFTPTIGHQLRYGEGAASLLIAIYMVWKALQERVVPPLRTYIGFIIVGALINAGRAVVDPPGVADLVVLIVAGLLFGFGVFGLIRLPISGRQPG